MTSVSQYFVCVWGEAGGGGGGGGGGEVIMRVALIINNVFYKLFLLVLYSNSY